MSLFFANPWGLLALLGIPAVLAIHLLRRKSRTVAVSTLFLVSNVLKSREGGRRVQMLRSSWPLLFQLLAVTALAVLISQPRWIGSTSSLKFVVVMDSSASMEAFRKAALADLRRSLESAGLLAGAVDMRVMSSSSALLASGRDSGTVAEAVEKNWKPAMTSHDVLPALRLARNLAGPKGIVLWITDHCPEDGSLPEGVEWISCGIPTDNAAFLASSVDGSQFTVWLRNFSDSNAPIRWKARQASDWNELAPASDGVMEIRGAFPEDGQPVELELTPDALAIDNAMPLVLPVLKPLAITTEDGALFERILRIAGPVVSGEPDLVMGYYDPLSPALPQTSAMIFLKDPAGTARKPLAGDIVSENHPLMEGLDWRGLILRDAFQVPAADSDEVLLWLGTRPVIFQRKHGDSTQLIFNFDVESSTASRLPAFALLLHRFLEQQRSAKIAYSAGNVATGEKLNLPGTETAPDLPGVFSRKTPDGNPIFDGAAQFGDPRESDLRKASSGSPEWKSAQAVQQQNAEGKNLDVWWLLLAGVFLLTNWWLTGSASRFPANA